MSDRIGRILDGESIRNVINEKRVNMDISYIHKDGPRDGSDFMSYPLLKTWGVSKNDSVAIVQMNIPYQGGGRKIWRVAFVNLDLSVGDEIDIVDGPGKVIDVLKVGDISKKYKSEPIFLGVIK